MKICLPSILLGGTIGCIHSIELIDNRTMAIWYNGVIKLYIAGCNGSSGLSLNDIQCHHSVRLSSLLEENNVRSPKIPPLYTAMLQPCDVGIRKSLEDSLKQCTSKWRRETHDLLTFGAKFLTPNRIDVLSPLKEVWRDFPVEVVPN